MQSCREKNRDELLEIFERSKSSTIRDAAKRLRRGIAYTRSLAEELEQQRKIVIRRYRGRVSDWWVDSQASVDAAVNEYVAANPTSV